MGWLAADFLGLRTNQMATALSELCVAVNEREEALGVASGSWTKFTINTGSTKAKPDPEDFIGPGMTFQGHMPGVLQEILDAVADLVDTWDWATSDAEPTTPNPATWTVMALATDIGLSGYDFDGIPATMDGNWWEFIREALNRLTHVVLVFGAGGTYNGREADGVDPTDSWENAVAQSPASQASQRILRWRALTGTDGGAIYDDHSESLATAQYDGAFYFGHVWVYGSGRTAVYSATWGSTGGVSPTPGSGLGEGTPTKVTISPSVSSNFTLTASISTGEPGASPWDGLPAAGIWEEDGGYYYQRGYVVCGLNLSSILADQS